MKKAMQKVLPFLLISLLFSCDKEDENKTDASQLIGTWLLTRETDSDGEEDIYTSDCQNTWQFTANMITARWDDDCDGNADFTDSIGYSLDGNKIIYASSSTELENVVIKSLSQTKLEIEITEASGPDDIYIYNLFFDRVE